MRDTLNKLWVMKPKQFKNTIKDSDIINIYLEEFFNTSFEKEIQKDIYDKTDGKLSPQGWSLFFSNFKVTETQHKWWYNELFNLFSKKYKINKQALKKNLFWTDLQIGPSIKRNEHNI